ncbi:uncharacterized protein LOC100556457 isoform X7 [Anolis carolinensis]|uniref:uncharacterized protein LOC100556457 isoform X7 n=1 Tax=Anolis carolinensis TaxID=28377 RepID=UPI002F2B81A1
MASMEQRKRRKKFHNGKPMEVGPCEPFTRSRKKSADTEQFARKYMQKCTVESSTESESDVNTEVLSNKSLEKTNLTQLPFLDPYDGDYEEVSGGSDCSLGSLDSSHSKAIFLRRHVTEGECHSTEPVIPTLPGLLKSVTQEDGPASFKTATTLQLNTEPSCFTEPPSSKKGLFQGASSDCARPQPTSMECDAGLCNEPNITRKHKRSVLESVGETLKKRLRVA